MNRRPRPHRWLLTLWLASAACAVAPAAGLAQVELELVAPLGPSSEATALWLRRVTERPPAGTGGTAELVTIDALAERLGLGDDTIDRDDLEVLHDVQRGLIQARARAAQLDEAGAYQRLHAAEQALLGVLRVPGSAWLLAEVYTAQGLIAAQAGWLGLAEACLRRAATLDPSRGLGAAETTPQWVAVAERLSQQAATAPVGEVPVQSDPPGAQVFVDDQLQGVTPLRLRLRRGVHVVRVQAAGRRPVATLLSVDAGSRPALVLTLPEDPLLASVARLARAARGHDVAGATASVAELRRLVARSGVTLTAVWLLRTSEARHDHALLARCDGDTCDAPRRLLVLDPAESYGLAVDPSTTALDDRARQAAWLAGDPTVPATRTEIHRAGTAWGRWVAWIGAVALVGAVTTWAVLVSQPEPDTRLRVTVDP